MKKWTFTITTVAALSFAACTATISGDPTPGPLDDGFFDSKPTIAGPEVEGRWASLCRSKGAQLYRRFDFVFENNTVIRNELIFNDSQCVSPAGQVTSQGRFRFIEKFSDESFGIEYAFEDGSGITTFPQEKILVDANVLYISNFQTGEAAPILRSEPLYKDTSNSPTPPSPTPTPAPVKSAIIASSYSEARYAACITQRSGVVIDFQGVMRGDQQVGKARIGTKRCRSNQPIQWSSTLVDYSVRVINGYPNIDFSLENSKEGSIRPWGSYKGLRGTVDANATFFGNSGGCYFTVNDGLANLPFRETCF